MGESVTPPYAVCLDMMGFWISRLECWDHLLRWFRDEVVAFNCKKYGLPPVVVYLAEGDIPSYMYDDVVAFCKYYKLHYIKCTHVGYDKMHKVYRYESEEVHDSD